MKCPFCGEEHEAKQAYGFTWIECPQIPQDIIRLEQFTVDGNEELRAAVLQKQWLDDQLRCITGFWDTGEPAQSLHQMCKENRDAIAAGRKFAESVYLAMDWPTFPNVRGL